MRQQIEFSFFGGRRVGTETPTTNKIVVGNIDCLFGWVYFTILGRYTLQQSTHTVAVDSLVPPGEARIAVFVRNRGPPICTVAVYVRVTASPVPGVPAQVIWRVPAS
jgi:hypothetical protein